MKKILVVDDDVGIVEMVQFVLEEEGYEVQTSLDGACLREMQAEWPDLILLDVLLLGADGRELCRLVKSREQTRHIPVILFSAHVSAENSIAASGADDFLAKPFRVRELLEIVARRITAR